MFELLEDVSLRSRSLSLTLLTLLRRRNMYPKGLVALWAGATPGCTVLRLGFELALRLVLVVLAFVFVDWVLPLLPLGVALELEVKGESTAIAGMYNEGSMVFAVLVPAPLVRLERLRKPSIDWRGTSPGGESIVVVVVVDAGTERVEAARVPCTLR